jgi:hypothetical protein
MSRRGKKSKNEATMPSTDSNPMSVVIEIMKQQAEDRKRLDDEIREERRAAEERFNLLVQAMTQTNLHANNADVNHTTQPAKQTLRPPTNSAIRRTHYSRIRGLAQVVGRLFFDQPR